MRLYKHKNGMFYVALPGNIRKSLNTRNEREANAKYKQLERLALNQKLVNLDRGANITYDALVSEFLDTKLDINPDTVLRYSQTFNQFKISFGGADIPVKLITSDTVTNFIKWCLNKKLQKTSINTYLIHIKLLLSYAVNLKYIAQPVKFKLLKVPKHLPRVLSVEEIDLILYAIHPDVKHIVQFALFTGCRISEIMHLQWQHIKNNMATITGKGNKQRTVPLVKGALEAMGPVKNYGPIFKQYARDTVSRYFKRAARSVGIEDVHFHNLRHSAATQMLACGVSLPVVQSVLGHEVITTTFIYTKVVDPLKIAEMQKLDYPDFD